MMQRNLRQLKVTDFLQKVPLRAGYLPIRVLLQGTEIDSAIIEQGRDMNCYLLLEKAGKQKLLAIAQAPELKQLLNIPIPKLSPSRLREIFPKIPERDILRLNEVMLKLYREKCMI